MKKKFYRQFNRTDLMFRIIKKSKLKNISVNLKKEMISQDLGAINLILKFLDH